MGWVAARNPVPTEIVNDPPGFPNRNFVSQWPEPESVRVAGTWRWISEPLHRPMSGRYYGWLDYSISNPWVFPNLFDFREYFWIDVFETALRKLEGEAGVSPYGSTVKLIIEYLDPVPGFPFAGVSFKTEARAAGENELTRISAHEEFVYNDDNRSASPAQNVPNWEAPYVGETYPYVNVTAEGMALCFPVDQFFPVDPDPNDMNEPFEGVLVRPSASGQNLAADPVIDFGVADYEFGGDWWDIGTPKEIVIPTGVRWVRMAANVQASTSATRLALFFARAGSLEAGFPVAQIQAQTFLRRCNIASGPIEVSAGDVFTLFASTTTGTVNSADSTWAAMEAVSTPTELINHVACEWSKVLSAAPSVPDDGYIMIPDAMDGMVLTNLTIALGDAQSSAGVVEVQVNKLSAATRASVAMLSTTITIDANEWSSLTAAIPAVINPAFRTLGAGDILEVEILQNGTAAEGLGITLQLESPL